MIVEHSIRDEVRVATPAVAIASFAARPPSLQPAMGSKRRGLAKLDALVKRSLDVLVASLALIMAAPLMLLIALLVAIDGGPVLFRHIRLGAGLRPFACLKFRTMILGAEPCLEEYLDYHPAAKAEWLAHQKLDFDPRITPIGKVLRRTSLDELPQLINVLRGDMSLVGPRPITLAESHRYGDVLPLYAAVRPGITGLWQVGGRNDIGYEARIAIDACYVRARNIVLDIAILVATPGVVLSRRGAR